jgi:hypothetical protein
MSSCEILPPVEVEGKLEVVGIATNYKNKTITISCHTQPKERPPGFEPDDYKSVTFSYGQLKWLSQRLPDMKQVENPPTEEDFKKLFQK